MAETGVTAKYDELIGRFQALPFQKKPSLDIRTYVVGKALDGLFYVLGQEEKNIRRNPAARVTSLLQRVFGR
jgi:beta-galactosidase GanA